MSIIKRHPLITFFVAVYLLTWFFWGTSAAQARGWISFHLPQSLGYWIGLTVATLLVTGLTSGWIGIREVLNRVFRWKVNPLWYLAAAGLTLVICVVAIVIDLALGDPSPLDTNQNVKSLLGEITFSIFFFTMTEELAWRGFALPRIQENHPPLKASLILGVLWALWHTPLFLIPGTFQSGIPYFGFFLLTVAESILTTWIFNHARGSALLTGIFHAIGDVTIVVLGVMTNGLTLLWLFIIVQWICAVVIILADQHEWFTLVGQATESV